MITYIAWLLIGSTVFLATFYLNLYFKGEIKDSSRSLSDYPAVTVLMPAYNEEETVEESLENVLELDYPDYEVMFVDDGSGDSTLEKAREFSGNEDLKIISHEENRGKASALNTGLKNTDSSYVIVQDADSRIEDGLLEKAVERMEGNEDLGGVIASIRPVSTNNFVQRLQEVQYRVTNFYRSMMSRIDTLDVTPGAFSIYRKKDLLESGGFDENNPKEDLEMAWRLRKIGREIEMVYGRHSATEFPDNFYSLYRQRVRWARGSIFNSLKHRDMFLNREYGWFGLLQLPIHILSPLIAVTSLALVGIGISEGLFSYIVRTSAVGISLPQFQFLGVRHLILSSPVRIYVPLSVSLIASALIIRYAYRKAGDSVKNPLSLVSYYLGFFVLYGSFWSVAILKELLRSKRVWT